MANTLELLQGSDEWRAARCGSLGASAIHEALAKTKSGYSASRANIEARLVAERLTGVSADSFTNAAMQWGTDQEPNARAAYEFENDCKVVEVGLYRHPSLPGTHASPDGLVGDDGLLEVKCPNTATHIATLLGASIDQKYIYQMQWQMRVCERQWCDFVSYDPRLPIEMQLHVRRVDRDDELLAEMEAELTKFLAGVDAKVAALTNQYSMKEAA